MGELLDKLNAAVTEGRHYPDDPAFTVTEAEVAPLEPLLEQDAKAGGADLLAFFERAKADLNIHIKPPVFGTFWRKVGTYNLPRGSLIPLEVRELGGLILTEERERIEGELRAAYPDGGFLEARFEFVERIRTNPGIVILDPWLEEAIGLEPAALKASALVDKGDEVADRDLRDVPWKDLDRVRNSRCREAVGFYRRAIATDPNYLRAYRALSNSIYNICNDFDYSDKGIKRIEERQGRYQRVLRPLLKRNPHYADGWMDHASYHYDRKHYDKAREAYEKCLTLERPAAPFDYLYYGKALEETGRIPEAFKAYEDCMDRDEVDPDKTWGVCMSLQIGLFAPVFDLKVEFAKGSSELRADQKRALNHAAAFLKKYPDLKRFHVEGNTGFDGTEADQLRLSEERAKAVRDYLISKGVDPAILVAVGHGTLHYQFLDTDPDTGKPVIHEYVGFDFMHEPHPPRP